MLHRILMLTSAAGAQFEATELATLATSGPHVERIAPQIDWVSPFVITPRFADMKQAVGRLGEWRTLAFTSGHAVDALVSALRALGHDVRALFGKKLVAVGGVTAARLERYGLTADLIADGGAEALAQAIVDAGAGAFPDPVLHPRALAGRHELAEVLTAAGRRVEVVPAYETSVDEAALGRVLRAHAEEPYDAIGFFSPRGVEAFLEIFGAHRLAGVRLGAIGETTRKALEARELGPIMVAEHASAGALLAALLDVMSVRG